MDTKDTQNLLMSVMTIGAVACGFLVVALYVWTVFQGASNEKLALLAGTAVGALLTMAKDAWKDYVGSTKSAATSSAPR